MNCSIKFWRRRNWGNYILFLTFCLYLNFTFFFILCIVQTVMCYLFICKCNYIIFITSWKSAYVDRFMYSCGQYITNTFYYYSIISTNTYYLLRSTYNSVVRYLRQLLQYIWFLRCTEVNLGSVYLCTEDYNYDTYEYLYVKIMSTILKWLL